MSLLITGTGPTVERTYTYPDADARILTDHDLVTPAQGGTGIGAYSVGDMVFANGAAVLTKLQVGSSAGMFLRSTGTAPAWSTLVLPNTATQGDLMVATAANTVGSVAAVATGSVLVSGGVGSLPAWSASPTLTSVLAPLISGTQLTLNSTSAEGRLSNSSTDNWGWNSATFYPLTDNLKDLGDGTHRVRTGYFGTSVVTPSVVGPAATNLALGGAGLATWLFDGSTQNFYPGVDASYTFGLSNRRITTGFFSTALVVGTNPASAGDARFAHGFALNARNNANSADRNVLRFGAITADTVELGSSATNTTILGSVVGVAGMTASFPALKRSGTTLAVRLADDSADAPLTSGTFTSSSHVIAAGAAALSWNGRAEMRSPSDGIITLYNSTDTDFSRLQFGGSTASFPALTRSGATLGLILADNSAYAQLDAGDLIAHSSFKGPGTVASAGDWRAQNAFTFKARNAPNTADGTILSTDSLDLTKLGSATVTVADNATISLGASTSGMLFIQESSGEQAAFALRGGGGAAPNKAIDTQALFSVTAGSAGLVNVYWSAGNSRYELENKRGASRTFRLVLIGS